MMCTTSAGWVFTVHDSIFLEIIIINPNYYSHEYLKLHRFGEHLHNATLSTIPRIDLLNN